MIMFDNFYSADFYSTIVASDKVEQVVPNILLPGRMSGDDETIDVLIQLLDLDNGLWTPTILRGKNHSDVPGVLITNKAARDLGVNVGDDVSLLHPYRESQHAWRMEKSSVRVIGIHPDIIRTTVYMDVQDASLMNLQGSANSLYVNPAAGVSIQDLRQELFPVQEVASVQRASAAFESIESMLDQFMGIFQVVQVIVLVMAFFIAFNTTRSNMDERRRDLATMFAFGTPVNLVVRMAMVENLVIGLLGTALGMALGAMSLNAMWNMRMETMMPELNAVISIAPATFGWAIFIGVVVVTLTPLLVARRLAGMDIPSTLRVLE
jgi:putative ABC transport system permease protein